LAFIGYLIAGTAGAIVASIGIFLPVYIFTIIPAPWFRRHRQNSQLQAFAAGATSAASGAIAGAVVVLGQRAIFDIPTVAIGVIGLVLLWKFRLQEPILVAAAGLAGLMVWPLFRGG
jgi:chromate transporter